MKEVKKWIKKAERDLNAAKINLQQGLFDISSFLSHQAAEKALKALHILKFKRLWKIHDLEKLCIAVKSDKKIIEISKKLNPHYIETRYPIEARYTKKIAEEALANAKAVVEWVKQQLKKLKEK
jgi:HEPN domain-containing protein